MTMSSAPTAELPIVEPPIVEPLVDGPLVDGPALPASEVALGSATLVAALTPEVVAGEPAATASRPRAADSPDAVEVVPCRADLRAERRQARRRRRIHAAAGLAVLVCTLGATVAVLDVLH
jgi:hypothetical protein